MCSYVYQLEVNFSCFLMTVANFHIIQNAFTKWIPLQKDTLIFVVCWLPPKIIKAKRWITLNRSEIKENSFVIEANLHLCESCSNATLDVCANAFCQLLNTRTNKYLHMTDFMTVINSVLYIWVFIEGRLPYIDAVLDKYTLNHHTEPLSTFEYLFSFKHTPFHVFCPKKRIRKNIVMVPIESTFPRVVCTRDSTRVLHWVPLSTFLYHFLFWVFCAKNPMFIIPMLCRYLKVRLYQSGLIISA